MKRTNLLIVLPLALVMTSCGGNQEKKEEIKEEKKEVTFSKNAFVEINIQGYKPSNDPYVVSNRDEIRRNFICSDDAKKIASVSIGADKQDPTSIETYTSSTKFMARFKNTNREDRLFTKEMSGKTICFRESPAPKTTQAGKRLTAYFAGKDDYLVTITIQEGKKGDHPDFEILQAEIEKFITPLAKL